MFVFTPDTDAVSAPRDFGMIQFARLKTHENHDDCRSTVVETPKSGILAEATDEDSAYGPKSWPTCMAGVPFTTFTRSSHGLIATGSNLKGTHGDIRALPTPLQNSSSWFHGG